MRNNKATKKTASTAPATQKTAASPKTKNHSKKEKKKVETLQKMEPAKQVLVAVKRFERPEPLPGPFIRSVTKANTSHIMPSGNNSISVAAEKIELERIPSLLHKVNVGSQNTTVPQLVNQVPAHRTFAEILASQNGKTGLQQNVAGIQQQKNASKHFTVPSQNTLKPNVPPSLPISRPQPPSSPSKSVTNKRPKFVPLTFAADTKKIASASTGLRTYSQVVVGIAPTPIHAPLKSFVCEEDKTEMKDEDGAGWIVVERKR
ncbi:hypothetical protein BC829DRAFT_419690 [Chytridium lagenaria]|nr:hypothetical protein BC829DRAFT_419690 [Chytridium lagenaria]